ncbi:MAG: patatin-like phospholipase family protein, partial [Chlamydiota bacterium]
IFSSLSNEVRETILQKSSYLILQKGKPLLLQGEKEEHFYLIVTGRFYVYQEEKKITFLGELGPHDTIGELSLLADEISAVSIIANKNSSVLSFPKNSFLLLLQHTFPHLIKKLAKNVDLLLQKPTYFHKNEKFCFLPVNVQKQDFSQCIQNFLQEVKEPHRHLTPKDFYEKDSFEEDSDAPYIFYEGENTLTPWTKWCMQEADRIIFVINPHLPYTCNLLDPFSSQFSPSFLSEEILFIHPKDSTPSRTDLWLQLHPCKAHHHLFLEDKKSYEHLYRILMGKGIHLVLGGGGARAFAHIGILQACKESDFPIDRIGGSSISALFGALYALGFNVQDVCRDIFTNLHRLMDYTVPTVSLLEGKKFFKYLQEIFHELHIEDTWIPFFSVSSDIATLQPYMHTKGRIDKAILASSSLPGIFPPVHKDGIFHIDGSLSNILPLDLMAEFGKEGIIVGIDVALLQEPKSHSQSPPYFSLGKYLLNKFIGKKDSFPTIFDTLLYSTFLHSTSKKEELLNQNLAHLYICPPLQEISSLQFSAFDSIVEKGYQYATQHMDEWKKVIQ